MPEPIKIAHIPLFGAVTPPWAEDVTPGGTGGLPLLAAAFNGTRAALEKFEAEAAQIHADVGLTAIGKNQRLVTAARASLAALERHRAQVQKVQREADATLAELRAAAQADVSPAEAPLVAAVWAMLPKDPLTVIEHYERADALTKKAIEHLPTAHAGRPDDATFARWAEQRLAATNLARWEIFQRLKAGVADVSSAIDAVTGIIQARSGAPIKADNVLAAAGE